MAVSKILCRFLVIVVVFSLASSEGDEKPFRMKKVQTVWEKAQKVITDKHKLAELYADLLEQDRAEKLLKKLKSHDHDADGLVEAQTRGDFFDIIERYDLEKWFPVDKTERLDKLKEGQRPNIKDEKLAKLWKTAEQAGFSDTEMRALREEFSHHQMKMDEYGAMQEEYGNLADRTENYLDDDDKEVQEFRKMQKIKMALKEKNMELKRGMQDLHDKMAIPEKKDIFSDPRVYKLWTMAKKSKMSKGDLESFREELTHFAHRIKKLDYMREKIDSVRDNDQAKYDKQTEALMERQREYEKKVDKYHETLEHKVKKALKHSEL